MEFVSSILTAEPCVNTGLNAVFSTMFCDKNWLISDELDISEASFRVLSLPSKFYVAVCAHDGFL